MNGHIIGFRPHTQKLSHLIKLYLHSGSERVKVEDTVPSCTSVLRQSTAVFCSLSKPVKK